MSWINLLIILLSCTTFVFVRNYITKNKRDIKLLILMVFMDSFMVMFQVMLLNMVGFNYGFLDEVIISLLYSLLLPSKYIERFEAGT